MTTARRLLLLTAVVYLGVVAWITLDPYGSNAQPGQWVFWWLGFRRVDPPLAHRLLEFSANVALFVPFGALARLLVRRARWWLVAPAALLTSVAIERYQAATSLYRVASLSDVVANTLGAVVGVLLVVAVRRRLWTHLATVVTAGVYGLGLAGVALWPRHVDEDLGIAETAFVRAVGALLGLDDRQMYAVVESLANVALFVPLGALAWALLPRWPWWRIVLLGLATSLAIELAQELVRPGRTADVRDVVANTLGTTWGVLLVHLWRTLSPAPPRHRHDRVPPAAP